MVPGLLVFLFGLWYSAMQQPNARTHAAAIAVVFVLGAAVCGSLFVGIARLNQRAARKLQGEIDALERAETLTLDGNVPGQP